MIVNKIGMLMIHRARHILWSTMALLTGIGLFLSGMYVAQATPGGATKDEIVFAGTLLDKGSPVAGPVDLMFEFRTTGGILCSVTVAGISPDKKGHFIAPIALDECSTPPNVFPFDGDDVTVHVWLDGNEIGSGPVSAVPYAKYADRAAQATGELDARIATIEASTSRLQAQASGPNFSFTVPQSELGGPQTTSMLTIRANGDNCILASTFLIHTGDNHSGVAASEIGIGGTYGSCDVDVSPNLAFGGYNNDPNNDGTKGVSVNFSQMPTLFGYSYTISHIGSL